MKKNGIALAIILIILVMTLVACSNTTDATDKSDIDDFVVTIHPNNGDPNVKWDISDPIPVFEKEGFEIEGYYLDSDFTTEVVLTSLKKTGINGDIDIYIKWKRNGCDHEIVIDEAVPATCTKTGMTEGKHCSKCGEVLLAQTEVPTTNHTYSSDCDIVCNVCSYERVTSVGHTYDHTCDTTCNDCGATRITTTAHSDVNPADNNCDVCGEKVSTLTFTLSDDGQRYAITDANLSISGDITIPSTYNGKPVTTIGGRAFRDCHSLTSIVIPDSVTTIGYGAFSGCTSLTDVYYLGTLEQWCGISFGRRDANPMCNADNLYIDGTLLTGELAIPDSVTTIGEYAFSDCTSLTSVTFGENSKLTTIGSSAFAYCDSLTSIVIPDSVTTIGRYAFEDCTSLTSITVDENNPKYKSIDGNLYSKDEKTLIQYAIGKTATSFVIPDSVTSIDLYAFYYCTNLTSIVIPDSVTTIGAGAFCYCTNLTSVVIPDSVTTIGAGAFDGCYSLRYNTYGNAKYLGNESNPYLVLVEETSTSITSCEINENCKVICEYAFNGCTSLTSITIPASVTAIGYEAFSGCTSLTSISVDENNPNYKSIDGNLYSKDGKTLIQYAIGKTATSFVIPDSVTTIGSSAFSSCDSLTSIVIPDGVTSIGDGAFQYCSGLTSVTIGDSVTSIGDLAFCGCNCLTSVTFGDSVTTIGRYAFYICTSLRSITIPDSVTSIGDGAFWNCSSLTSVTFEDTTTWYRTTDDDDWSSKTGGTKTSVTDPSTNATYFTSTYKDYFWYKK